MAFGISSVSWSRIKRKNHNISNMLFTAICNTMIGMGPYYLESTYKWFKMALWDAPTRVFLDIQLEQMRLERNLSEDPNPEEKQEWKNTTSQSSLTRIGSLFSRRLKPSVRTSSALFGTKFSIVPNLSTLHPHLGNVQLIPGCRRLLCPETSSRC